MTEKVILRIPKISRIHWILFLLTIFTTLFAGAIMEGAQIYSNPLEIFKGIPFSFTLLFIFSQGGISFRIAVITHTAL